MRRPVFNGAERARIVANCATGVSVVETARQLGCNAKTIENYYGRIRRGDGVWASHQAGASNAERHREWTLVCYVAGCAAERAEGSKFCERHAPQLGRAAHSPHPEPVEGRFIRDVPLSRLMAGR